MEPLPWTDARIARLKAMVAEGASAAMIATALGGVSRNAVAGKVHRLGMVLGMPSGGEGAAIARDAKRGLSTDVAERARRRAQAQAEAQKSRRTRPAAQVLPPEPEIDPTPKAWPKPEGPNAVALVDLDMVRQCRMPLWGIEAKSGLYCGEPVRAPGERWCRACAALVYERRPARQRETAAAAQQRLIRQTMSGVFA